MKVNSIKSVTALKYLKGYEIEYTNKNGNLSKWEIVSRGSLERLNAEITSGVRFSDGAMIVAMDREKERVVILKEYRVSTGRYIYMFPAGLIDEGEDILTAATREFKEETGMNLDPVYAEPPRYVSAGIVNECVNVVYGYFSGSPSKAYQSEHEDADILIIDRLEAKRILKEDEVSIRTALILQQLFKLNPFVDEF